LPPDYLHAAAKHYCFAVNAGIVQHQATTRAGAIHLAAANIQGAKPVPPVPQQGCVLLPQQPGSEAASIDGQRQQCQDLPWVPCFQVLDQLQQVSLLANERLLGALQAYQSCSDISHMVLVDTAIKELACPAPLAAFVGLQRVHLENTMELLQVEWAIKVCSVPCGMHMR
jgi:hypothetical protein